MAIVNMDKISIVGIASEKNRMMDYLMKKGFIQIDDSSHLAGEEEFNGILKSKSNPAAIADLEEKLFHISEAISIVSKLSTKKSGFSDKKSVFERTMDIDRIYGEAEEINKLKLLKAELISKESACKAEKKQFSPWSSFNIELDRMETRYTRFFLGTLPLMVDLGAVRSGFDKDDLKGFIYELGKDAMLKYVYVAVHKYDYEAVLENLKFYRFQGVDLGKRRGSVSQIINDCDEKISDIKKDYEHAEKRLLELSGHIAELENLYDYYYIELEKTKETEKLVYTNNTFFITGWLPAENTKPLREDIEKKFECYIETAHGDKEEGFPILLKNNAFVTPFESITKMYSYPSAKDVDPNGVLAIFYTLFFGIMFGDLAYGLILAAGCGGVCIAKKYKKGEGNMLKMLAICGLSTAFFGILMGSFFGGIIPMPALIDPINDVMPLMAISFLLGIIHLFAGLGIKGYGLLKEGKVLDALFDVVFWYIFVLGGCMAILPTIAEGMEAVGSIGVKMLIVGAVLLTLTQGRGSKGLFKKLFDGVGSLYGITAYFADILSYSRVMALCLTTAVISQVINLLCEITGPIPAIFIFPIGHTINFLINALGTYVHTSRLHYVEFFGKFYEGGGTPYTPFRENTKYTVTQ